jgi:hypothetical protein
MSRKAYKKNKDKLSLVIEEMEKQLNVIKKQADESSKPNNTRNVIHNKRK